MPIQYGLEKLYQSQVSSLRPHSISKTEVAKKSDHIILLSRI